MKSKTFTMDHAVYMSFGEGDKLEQEGLKVFSCSTLAVGQVEVALPRNSSLPKEVERAVVG